MKNISMHLPLAVLLVSAAMAGCATKTPQLDATFGDAVTSAKALQIINPDASLNEQSPEGMGGKAAGAAMDRYYESYKTPPVQSNVFTIGIGDSGAGGGGGGR